MFIVRRLNKNGSISKAPLTRLQQQYDHAPTFEGAMRRRVELERLNPGKLWAVVTPKGCVYPFPTM